MKATLSACSQKKLPTLHRGISSCHKSDLMHIDEVGGASSRPGNLEGSKLQTGDLELRWRLMMFHKSTRTEGQRTKVHVPRNGIEYTSLSVIVFVVTFALLKLIKQKRKLVFKAKLNRIKFLKKFKKTFKLLKLFFDKSVFCHCCFLGVNSSHTYS